VKALPIAALVLVAGATCASAQGMLGMLPPWADSAFRASPAAGLKYSLTARVQVADP